MKKNNGFHCNHRRPYNTFNVGLPSCEYLGLISPFQCEDRLYTSESDVCRCQMLTYKDGSRTERTKILMAVVP